MFIEKIKSIFGVSKIDAYTPIKSIEKLSDAGIENIKSILEIVINHIASHDDLNFKDDLDKEVFDLALSEDVPNADFLKRKGEALLRAIFDIAYFHESFDMLDYTNGLDEDVLNFSLSKEDPANNSNFLVKNKIDVITIWHIRAKLDYNKTAYKEFELLANLELLEAQEHLAFMYRIGSGFGIEPNREKAIYWYTRAISNNSISAIKDLKYMKENP